MNCIHEGLSEMPQNSFYFYFFTQVALALSFEELCDFFLLLKTVAELSHVS